jgi:hypothetical protein
MKRRTSGIVEAIDRLTPKGGSRSETIERLLRESVLQRARRARDLKDLDGINRHADPINEEAEDVLTYQVDL